MKLTEWLQANHEQLVMLQAFFTEDMGLDVGTETIDMARVLLAEARDTQLLGEPLRGLPTELPTELDEVTEGALDEAVETNWNGDPFNWWLDEQE